MTKLDSNQRPTAPLAEVTDMAASDIFNLYDVARIFIARNLALYPVELSSGSVPVRGGFEPPTFCLKGEVSDNICIATVYYNLYSENIDNSLKINLINHNGFEPFKNLFKKFLPTEVAIITASELFLLISFARINRKR